MPRTRTVESLRILGQTVALLTPEEQLNFLGGFVAEHDRLANQISQETQGREDQRPILHDGVARALAKLRDYIGKQQP